MHYMFIGKDGSMGLKHGKTYQVCINKSIHHPYRIIAVIYLGGIFDRMITCPYGSMQAFEKNWKACC